MTNFQQIFVCATPGEGRCGEKGGDELLSRFREEAERRGRPVGIVQRNPCSRRHHEGPVVFIFPDDVWYTEVAPDDVAGILDRHLSAEARGA